MVRPSVAAIHFTTKLGSTRATRATYANHSLLAAAIVSAAPCAATACAAATAFAATYSYAVATATSASTSRMAVDAPPAH